MALKSTRWLHLSLFFKPLVAIGLVMMLVGCATLSVDPKLVAEYRAPIPVGEEETLIYVLRPMDLAGAAYPLWVACNDLWYGQLKPGEYCYFKVPVGINTVMLKHAGVSFGFHPVDDRPNKTIFLWLGILEGKLIELDADLGKSMVMKFKKATDIEATENTDLSAGLMNPRSAGLFLMKDADAVIEPTSNTATVTFIRHQDAFGMIPFGIWNQDRFLGSTKGKNYFVAELPAGSHTFVANTGEYVGLKAELEAGKRYFVHLKVNVGLIRSSAKLWPVRKKVRQSTIDNWIGDCQHLKLDTTTIDESIRERLEAARPYLNEAVAKVQSGEIEAPSLAAADGR